MASLLLKNITKKYSDGFIAVKESNLEIVNKEFIIFVGPSGYGKSTVLHMIAGLEGISSGELYIDDRLVNDVKPKDRDITTVFQNYALYPHMPACDNMAFGLKLGKTSKDEIDKKVHDAAKILDLEHLLDRKSKILSGGQRQRVAMGRTIIRSSKVFLMDKPLSNLDAKPRGQMRAEISKLHQKLETTITYVTHDQTEAMTLGTRIVIIKGGIIQQVDNPQNLYDKPCNKLVVGFIGVPQMNMIDATVGKDGTLITLSFDGRTVALLEAKLKKLEDVGYIGKAVTPGVHPEDLYDEGSYLTMSPRSVFEATVHVYEMLGPGVLSRFDIKDASFVARVNPRTIARPGDTIKSAMDLEKIHIFDKDMELVVLS